LALWFVFGWWFIPEMGIRGAAYAMGLSQVASCVAFGVIFLSKQNRDFYKTHRPSFSLSVIKRCLQVGGPGALNGMINIAGWAVLFQMFSKFLPMAQFAAYSIAHILYGTLWFFIEGVGKGVSTVVANRIGERAFDAVGETLKSVVKLQLIFSAIALLWMVFWPEPLVKLFLPNVSGDAFAQTLKLLLWLWVLFGFEFIYWALYQALVAGADTKFTTVINTVGFWLIAVIPSYWIVCVKGANVVWALRLDVLDLLVKIAIFYWRYRCGKWKSNSLTKAHA
jgi:MATE family multidrug resistance protein